MKASIYQRKSDKKWVGCVDITSTRYADTSKKRDRITVYGDTEKEVRSKTNDIIYEIEHDLYAKVTNDSLVAFLCMYLEANKNKWQETTYALYKNYIVVHIEPYFKNTQISKIKIIDIDKFYNYKLEKLSGNMVMKLHKFLNSAFNYGVKKEILKSNPCMKATVPNTKTYKPTVYNQEQFMKLWDSIEDDVDRVYISLAAGVGLRRGEICGLQWSDIDFKNSMISISRTITRYDKTILKDTKNESSERAVYAPQYVMDVLKDYKAKTDVYMINGFIIPYKPQSISERFRKLLEKNDLTHIRLHDLRHFNATMMMMSGIPDKVAAGRLGHAQTSTLKNIYQHVLDDMNKEASNKLNSIFANKKAAK